MKNQLHFIFLVLILLTSHIQAQVSTTCENTELTQACGILYEDVSNTGEDTWLQFVAIDNFFFCFVDIFCSATGRVEFFLYEECNEAPIFTFDFEGYSGGEFGYSDLIIGQTYYIQFGNIEMAPCEFFYYVENFGEPLGIDLAFNETEYADGCSDDLSENGQFCNDEFIRFTIEDFGVENIGILQFEVFDENDNFINFDWESENDNGQNTATLENPNYIDISFEEAGTYNVCLSSADIEGNCTVLYTDFLCTEVTILEGGLRIEETISLCYEDLLNGIEPDVEDENGIPWQSGEIFLDDIEDGVVEQSFEYGCGCMFTDILYIDILYPGQEGCRTQEIKTCPQWNSGLQLSIDGTPRSTTAVNSISDNVSINISVTEDILPDDSTIDWYLSTDANFTPGQSGQFLGSSNIESNWNSCNQQAEILSLLVESYSDPEEEVMVIGSGSGFYVDELILDIEDNCSDNCPTDCDSQTFGDGCDWTNGDTALLEGCDNIISVGPGDFIPPNSTLVLFINNKSVQSLLAENLCSSEGCIYVLTNSCDRCLDAFTDNASNSSYAIITSCGNSSISYGNNIDNGSGAYVTKELLYGEQNRGNLPPGYIQSINVQSDVSDFLWNADCNNLSQGNVYIRGIINSPIYNSACCSPYTPILNFNTNCSGTNPELNWVGATSVFLPPDIEVMNGGCEEGYSFGNQFFSGNLGIAYPYPLIDGTHYESTCPLNTPVVFSSSHSPQDIFLEGTTTVTYSVTDGCNTLTHSFDVTVICENDNVDDVFVDFPWLLDILDPNDCDGITIELYQFGSVVFPYVIIDDVGTLYSNIGLQYCRDFAGFNCVDAYGLGSPLSTWNCEGCNCPAVVDPVCGTDGNTYSNECEATCAGVAIASQGACDTNEPDEIFTEYPWLSDIIDPNDCEGITIELYQFGGTIFPYVIIDGVGTLYSNTGLQYCRDFAGFNCIDAYGLGSPLSTWTCDDQADDCGCTTPLIAVCGVDGNTYDSACLAECAGVEVDYTGECTTTTDDIFTEYPILSMLVDPNDCDGSTVSIYQIFGSLFYFVSSPTSNILYNQLGDRYCQDYPNFSCLDAYGIDDTNLVDSWTCNQKTVCYTGILTPTRPENPTLDPNGPYFQDEIVEMTLSLIYTADEIGAGNNCAWLQGIIPVLGSGWNIPDSNLEQNSEIPDGFEWYESVEYNLENNDIIISNNFYNQPVLSYNPAGGNLQAGTLLPGGWYYSSPGSGVNCTNDGTPDNSWGFPQACGSSFELELRFNLVADPCYDNGCGNECLDMDIDIFVMTDGETGCYSQQSCNSKPISLQATKECTTPGIQDDINLSQRSKESNNINVYPNPVMDVLNINYDAVYENSTLTIRTVNGTVIEKILLQKSTTGYQLDTQDYPSGIIFIEVIDGNYHSIEKISRL